MSPLPAGEPGDDVLQRPRLPGGLVSWPRVGDRRRRRRVTRRQVEQAARKSANEVKPAIAV